MKKQLLALSLLILIIGLFSVGVFAEEDNDDIEVFGLELEKVLYLGTGILASAIFVVSFVAYKRSGQQRLLYVSSAFILFALKGFMISSELFIEEISFVDPLASFLEFGIIILFFIAVLRK